MLYHYMIPRPDLIFSYWIFMWFILYKLKFKIDSPKFALILGTIYNVYLMMLMVKNGMDDYYIFCFFMTIVILKLVPLAYIWNEKINYNDIKTTILVFSIFLLYIFANYGNFGKIHNAYRNGESNLASGRVNSPLMKLFMMLK